MRKAPQSYGRKGRYANSNSNSLQFVTSAGIVGSGGTPEQFAASLDRDREAFAGLIKSLGVKAP